MVSRAFQVLSDPEKKAKYDRFGGDPDSRFTPSAGPSGASPFGGFGGGGFPGLRVLGVRCSRRRSRRKNCSSGSLAVGLAIWVVVSVLLVWLLLVGARDLANQCV